MIQFLTALASPVVNLIRDKQQASQKRQERQDQLEQARTEAKVKRIQDGDAAAAKLDELSIQQRGWKDEYLLLLTTLPLLLCFIPSWAHYVDQGFSALQNVPEYYWYALAMVYIDTFGFRRMVRMATEHWLGRFTLGGK